MNTRYAMYRLSTNRRVHILRCLVDGVSIRGTARITGTSKNTVLRLLTDIGPLCAGLLDEYIRNLRIRRLEVDEMWGFIQCKDKHLKRTEQLSSGERGSVWLWIAYCPETRLVPAWRLGGRSEADGSLFMMDVAKRLSCRVQLTSDGHKAYDDAVEVGFGGEVDYAQVVKQYGTTENDKRHRYLSSTKELRVGEPNPQHISTSLVERQNLTVRMSMRRFTRKTNGFSKKFHNLWCATALHYAHYNFIRPHQSLNNVAPAVAARLVDGWWELEDLVRMLERQEASGGQSAKAS